MKCPITVTILTKNEEALIERCIRSVSWADEVLVLDSGSTDGTQEAARAAGAVVHEQEWLGWVGQRQRAIELARNDWIFVLEADEIVTQELARSIIHAMAAGPSPADGYVVDRRDELFGRLLPNMKRAALKHTFVRLLNRQRTHYNQEELIHETVVCPGKKIPLDGLLLHWRNVSLIEQLRKDVDNAQLEATLLNAAQVNVGVMRLLLWPLLRFFWCYAFRGGYRVGMVGLMYSLLRAHSEFLRHAMSWEQQHTSPIPHPPETIWSVASMPPAASATSLTGRLPAADQHSPAT